MSLLSNVVVQDPVDARTLFTACLAAVGLPADAKWHLMDFGDTHMLQAKGNQGGSALVSVFFAPDGGLYPADREDVGQPAGYAYAMFQTPGCVPRSDHERIVRSIGQWVTDEGLRWSWRFEEEPWAQGSEPRSERAQEGLTPLDGHHARCQADSSGHLLPRL